MRVKFEVLGGVQMRGKTILSPTYHDVSIQIDDHTYRIMDDDSLELTCTRAGGWILWRKGECGHVIKLGSESSKNTFFKISVGETVVCERDRRH